MHEAPKNIRRRMVPRWRRINDTPSEELTTSKQSGISDEFRREFETLRALWFSQQDVVSASELLFAASLGFSDDSVHQAAQFIIDDPKAPRELKRLAVGKLPSIKEDVPGAVDHRQTFEIRSLKKKLREQPRNAIPHVELARAYISVGLPEKADRHIQIAIQLAPSSRFVLRSAARFDVHRGAVERSINAIEGHASRDPWLAATLVALADLSGKSIKRIKPIRELLEDTDAPSEKSELAAALGTLELKTVGLRKARKYFQISAQAPNENVVAQLFWLSKNYGVNFDNRLLEREEAFEAQAQSSADANNWQEAVKACLRWLENEPFAVRPAFEGGFIAAEMLGDFKAAKEFAHQGLISNPKTAGLMNNLAYALIMEGNLVEAKEWLQRAKHLSEHDSEREKAVLQATTGLMHYREGNAVEGAPYYIATILKARELKNEKLLQLAYIHFCYEELRIGHAPPFYSTDELQKFFSSDDASKDAKVVFKRLLRPMLLARQKYGLVDTGCNAPLPISAPLT